MFSRRIHLIIATISLIVTGYQARAAESHSLTESEYRWMLGHNLNAFYAAREVVLRHPDPVGVRGASKEEIELIFKKWVPRREITSIVKYATPRSNESMGFEYEGWVITLDRWEKVGIKNLITVSKTSAISDIAIGWSNLEDDSSWFRRPWFGWNMLAPFKALFMVSDMAEYPLGELLPLGRHYDNEGRVIEEYNRNFRNSPLQIVQKNPIPKTLEEIYADPRLLPSGLSFSEIKTISQNTKRSLVAVFDSGVDYNHPSIAYKLVHAISSERKKQLESEAQDLKSSWLKRKATLNRLSIIESILKGGYRGWDFIENEDRAYDYERSTLFADPVSHGTAVASVAAGDGIHTAVLPVRLIGNEANPETAAVDFEKAVEYAEALGARVINMSYSGHRTKDKEFAKAMNLEMEDAEAQFDAELQIMAKHPRMLFVLAAGNENPKGSWAPLNADQPGYLSHTNTAYGLRNVIVVASIKPDKTLSDFSVYGRRSVHVAAFGDISKLPFAGGLDHESAGTSFAAPEVAHGAAYILSKDPQMPISKVVEILMSNVVETPGLKGKLKWGGYFDFNVLKRAVDSQFKSTSQKR